MSLGVEALEGLFLIYKGRDQNGLFHDFFIELISIAKFSSMVRY
jgi:hypothetical protein